MIIMIDLFLELVLKEKLKKKTFVYLYTILGFYLIYIGEKNFERNFNIVIQKHAFMILKTCIKRRILFIILL